MLPLVRPREEDLHATDVGGMSNASAIGVRGLCGRGACHVRRPPDPAQARGGRAAPWLVPAGLPPRPQPGAWQIVSGRVRPHEKHITRTACAPGARCGASAARSRRRAADLCFRGASSAGLVPAPSGKAGAGRQRASPRARGCLAAPARWDRAAGGRAHRPWHGSARQAACDHAARWRLHENRRFARMALLMLDTRSFRLYYCRYLLPPLLARV